MIVYYRQLSVKTGVREQYWGARLVSAFVLSTVFYVLSTYMP